MQRPGHLSQPLLHADGRAAGSNVNEWHRDLAWGWGGHKATQIWPGLPPAHPVFLKDNVGNSRGPNFKTLCTSHRPAPQLSEPAQCHEPKGSGSTQRPQQSPVARVGLQVSPLVTGSAASKAGLVAVSGGQSQELGSSCFFHPSASLAGTSQSQKREHLTWVR